MYYERYNNRLILCAVTTDEEKVLAAIVALIEAYKATIPTTMEYVLEDSKE